MAEREYDLMVRDLGLGGSARICTTVERMEDE